MDVLDSDLSTCMMLEEKVELNDPRGLMLYDLIQLEDTNENVDESKLMMIVDSIVKHINSLGLQVGCMVRVQGESNLINRLSTRIKLLNFVHVSNCNEIDNMIDTSYEEKFVQSYFYITIV